MIAKKPKDRIVSVKSRTARRPGLTRPGKFDPYNFAALVDTMMSLGTSKTHGARRGIEAESRLGPWSRYHKQTVSIVRIRYRGLDGGAKGQGWCQDRWRDGSGPRPVELDSPIRKKSPLIRTEESVFGGYRVPMSGADIRMVYPPTQRHWKIADSSEVIEFSGCDDDKKIRVCGRSYYQNDLLVGDTIYAIHPQRMTTRSGDLRSFAYTRVTKMLQEKSSDE